MHAARQVQLPAGQAAVAELLEGLHHRVLPLVVTGRDEAADGEDLVPLRRPVRLPFREGEDHDSRPRR